MRRADDLALPRLLGEQVADGLLVDRLRRGAADVDALGMARRLPQQARVHEMVVDDDVGALQAGQPARRDQVRCAGPGPNEVHERTDHTGVRVALGGRVGPGQGRAGTGIARSGESGGEVRMSGRVLPCPALPHLRPPCPERQRAAVEVFAGKISLNAS